MLALAFSGGKDSLACWVMFRHENPLVLWVNTGKAYPETLALVDMVRKQSNLVEIRSDQEAQTQAEGLPSDLVPVNWSTLGQAVTGPKSSKVQNYFYCCQQNISAPLMQEAKARGITKLIRGERLSESYKSTARHGSVVDGIEFMHPIESWTAAQVLEYLARQMTVPAHFDIEHSSLDCYDCTAFVAHSKDRVAFTKREYPALYAKYAEKMLRLKAALAPSIRDYAEAL